MNSLSVLLKENLRELKMFCNKYIISVIVMVSLFLVYHSYINNKFKINYQCLMDKSNVPKNAEMNERGSIKTKMNATIVV